MAEGSVGKGKKGGSLMFYREFKLKDGSPGVIILTGKSKNSKTGDLVQSWILRRDMDPIQVRREGLDSSICGDCPRRPALKDQRPEGTRGCYVQVHTAPLAVWRAYHRGSYHDIQDNFSWFWRWAKGKKVRIGSYGDPGKVPWRILDQLFDSFLWKGSVGYTRQWKRLRHPWYRENLMASVMSEDEACRASVKDWYTFRGSPTGKPIGTLETRCPANKGTHCEDCMGCHPSRKRDRVIQEH
jgi:hypothetical protein